MGNLPTVSVLLVFVMLLYWHLHSSCIAKEVLMIVKCKYVALVKDVLQLTKIITILRTFMSLNAHCLPQLNVHLSYASVCALFCLCFLLGCFLYMYMVIYTFKGKLLTSGGWGWREYAIYIRCHHFCTAYSFDETTQQQQKPLLTRTAISCRTVSMWLELNRK